MTRRLAFTLAVLFVFLCAAFPASAANAKSCPQSAERLLQKSESETDPFLREGLIRNAIRLCPDEARPYLYLGRHFERFGLSGDALALQAYQEALRRTPDFAEIFRKAAISSLNQMPGTLWKPVSPMHPESALGNGKIPRNGSVESLLAKQPKTPKARLDLAKALTYIGEIRIRNNQAGGRALLIRAAELAPAYERPRKFLSRSLQQLGDFQFGGEHFKKAIDLYKEALKYVPDDPRVLKRIADAYDAWGGHQKEELAYLEMTVSALENGRPARAQVTKAEADARGERAWEVGKQFLAAADYANASRAFKVAVAWIPENALLHFDLGMALTRVDGVSNRQAALDHFKRSQVLFRENPPLDAAGLTNQFQRRLRIEIGYLTGKTNPWGYLLFRTSQTVREKALEFSLFVLFVGGVSGYLLRAGYRLRESTKHLERMPGA
jgi:tetratricopeptide (TPR) repeat protein